ncbi:MAG TPA: alpha/beta fold hydrolase [Chitinophaga sp.]|uniref:alpha/beta hydrolase n=1 Tax=Chitinophaga sp. TaxID=1869181 RepID=UPI002BDA5D84|nr:alpha/beta fold hydrolase [Chitinophaga sp.]HVI46468.1 alpha/beta fold hydrolase [Chitinophaga sp.]
MYKGFWMLLVGMCICTVAWAQDNNVVTGKWYGVSKSYYGEKQRLIIELEKAGEGYTGTMSSPDQTEEVIRFDDVVYRKDTLLLRRADIGFAYAGVWDQTAQQFKGIFTWSGQRNTLDLSRKEILKEDLFKRPQEPTPPFPYYTEEVKFQNTKENITLAGTFSRPRAVGKYPVVVMLSGSGPQDRNEEMAAHKTFLVLADYFARNGIATLRFDDRGTGASSGTYSGADLYDFANDARAAMTYLSTRKDIDPHSIGLLGHSEGAMIAQIVAANNNQVAFVVSMAGPGVTGRELVDQKLILESRRAGMPDSLIRLQLDRFKPYWDALASSKDIAVAQAKAQQALKEIYHHLPDEMKRQVTEAEFVSDLNFNRESSSVLLYKPLEYLKQIKCPFMAINGSKDLQVDADSNLNAIERALRENGNMLTTIRKFDGLNHMFQRCKQCTVAEYGELEQTIDPLVPEFIAHWIVQLPPWGR